MKAIILVLALAVASSAFGTQWAIALRSGFLIGPYGSQMECERERWKLDMTEFNGSRCIQLR